MLGKLAGIDVHKLYDVIRNASGNSDAFRGLGQKAFARDFRPGFALDLAHKDLRLALEMADDVGLPGMIAPQVMTLFRMARAKGMGVEDSSAVLRVYEMAVGQEIE